MPKFLTVTCFYKKQPVAMTIKSFVHFFKSGGVKGQSPLWDF